MRIPFRHGIVRYQVDNSFSEPSPTFLQPEDGGSSISLVASPDPTIITISHGDSDYLFGERKTVHRAWKGFKSGTDYWLYWDIDMRTAKRTFGYTTVEPEVSKHQPKNPHKDMHWYDTKRNVMKVYMRDAFVERLRVFAAKYSSGKVLEPYDLGSQVGINESTHAGTILFDELGKPLHYVDHKRQSRFLTTESNFTTHASNSASIRMEASVEFVTAQDNIAAYQLVSYHDMDHVGHASSTDTKRPIVGMIREDLYVGEVGTFISDGYVRNPSWDWDVPVGTRVFCDETGQVTTNVPQQGALQEVGKIVSSTTILLDIKPMIILE